MKGVAVECAGDGHTVPQLTGYPFLRVEDIYLPDGIVVQREFRTRHSFLSALCCFGKSFVWRAIAIDNDAGPRSGVCLIALPGHRDVSNEKKHHRTHQRTFHHVFLFLLTEQSEVKTEFLAHRCPHT